MNQRILLSGLCLMLGTLLQAQVNDGGSVPVSYYHAHLPKAIPVVQAPSLDMDQVRAEDEARAAKGELFTIGRILKIDVDPAKKGEWQRLRNGDRLWRVRIQSPGAEGLSLYFSRFALPKGARLHVYSSNGEHRIGGFTAENNHHSGYFATEFVYSDDIIVEYYEPVYAEGMGRFVIDEVGHGYKNVLNFGASGSCMVNVNCSEGTGKTNQRDAVTRILVRQGANQGWCSGSMINNARQDCTPYYLTAMHCGGNNTSFASASDLNQWIFYFNFQATGCANPGSSPSAAQTVTGATRRAYSFDNGGQAGSDFLLLQLNSTPPASYNIYYLGWDRNNTAVTGGYGIHHPSGDIKKVSTFTGTIINDSYGGTVAGTHWRMSWTATTNGHSVTEGGSSGSALFNNSGRLIGTLTGGAASCSNRTAPDYYGKMSYHWTNNNNPNADRRLRDWLDPDNTNITTLDGIAAPCAVAGNDAGITTINNPVPGSLICSNPVSPNVTLRNFGGSALTSVTIQYRIDAGTINNFNWTGNLAGGATTTVTLPNITAPTGAPFTFRAWTTNPNGTTDIAFSNDTAQAVSQIQVSQPAPYVQPFNGGSLPTSIQVFNPNNDAFLWTYNGTVNAFGGTGGSIMFDNFSEISGNNPGGTFDWFFLPPLNFTGQSNPQISFDVAYAPYSAQFSDTLIVAVATNCATNYTPLFYVGGADLGTTGGNVTTMFTPTAAQWITENISLSAYANTDQVSIAFINKSGYGQRLFVDNINVPAACNLTASVSAQTNVSCFGGNNGSVTVATNGGTAPYTFNRGTGSQSTGTFNNLVAGNYSITVTDNNGCTAVQGVTISQPASALSSSLSSQTNIACFGGTTGAFTVTASGGTANYTFNRGTGAQSNGTFSSLSAGTYNVTITDNNGCITTRSVTLTQPASGINTSISSQTNVGCFGANTGSVTVAASGGATPYTFNRGTGTQSTGTFNNLAAGTYNITVTDANGCAAVRSVTITQPASGINTSISGQTNVACFGGTTGSVTVAASGGSTPYTFNRGTGTQSTGTFNNLSAGTYNITVTDNSGCQAVRSVTITQPASALSSSTSSQTNIACFGGNTGAFTVAASGGTSPYTFNRGTGTQSNGSFSNLSAGTYNVTITDANGCAATRSVTLTQPASALTASIGSQSNLSCLNSNNGSITVNASGGTPNYTYNRGLGPQSQATFNNLAAGTYNITVTDNNGCQATTSATLTQPTTGISTSISSQTNVACFGGTTGSVTVAASNGATPYTFNRGTGTQSTGTFNNLAAGTYNITVTDNAGCQAVQSVAITQPNSALSSVLNSQSNIACFGGSNGAFAVTASGGTSPYTFNRGTGTQTNGTFSNLSAGTYNVTITDANGCTATRSVNLSQPSAALSASVSSQNNPTCLGESNGSFTVSASGGTPGYIFNRGAGPQASSTFTGLGAGNYSITVTDANACTATTSTSLSEPATALSLNLSTTPTTCAGNDGEAFATASGGSTPYSYAWSNGATGNVLSGLPVGNITVSVTDANGCVRSQTALVANGCATPCALTATANAQDASCAGLCNGQITTSLNGGTAPFSYTWSNGANTANPNNVCAGGYTVTVSDAQACTATATVTVSEPSAISVSISETGNGQAGSQVSGGTSPYNYLWSNGATTADVNNLVTGNYSLIVTDANGCSASSNSLNIQVASSLTNTTEGLQNFQVYPNPSQGHIIADIRLQTDTEFSLRVVDVLGREIQHFEFQARELQLPLNLSEQAAGVYFLVLQTKTGLHTQKFIIERR